MKFPQAFWASILVYGSRKLLSWFHHDWVLFVFFFSVFHFSSVCHVVCAYECDDMGVALPLCAGASSAPVGHELITGSHYLGPDRLPTVVHTVRHSLVSNLLCHVVVRTSSNICSLEFCSPGRLFCNTWIKTICLLSSWKTPQPLQAHCHSISISLPHHNWVSVSLSPCPLNEPFKLLLLQCLLLGPK